jgi:hypothetical protein
MFIDESGEANVTNTDPRFNIFVLCGVIFREDDYLKSNDGKSCGGISALRNAIETTAERPHYKNVS